MSKNYYSVLWYTQIDEKGEAIGDFEEREFETKHKALNFYNRHKNNKDKFWFWVTKRDNDGFVITDIIY